MHTFNETAAAGVPAFLAKLWRLVEDADTNHLIYWQSDGRSFVIQNQAQFARELLPLNYKHNNMASFIRQLNMYGFHKITSIDNGGLKFDRDEMEFSHPCFQKDHPFLLEHIKRKIANPKQPAVAAAVVPSIDEKTPTIKPELVNKVMNEVKVMRTRQETLDNRFSAMKKENEALWREVAILRQKHAKQQQIVNKLIQFLVTLVQPARGGGGINNMSGVKRRFQLMINDVPESSKSHKSNEDSGTVIRELTDDLFDQVDYENYDEDTASPNVLSPAEDHSEHDPHTDTVSTSDYKVESHSVVDHPESEDEDIRMETVEFDDKIKYIIDEMSPPAAAYTISEASPTHEWLENNVLSPQQIKQEELDDQITIRSISENYGRATEKSYSHTGNNAKRNRMDKTQQGTSLLNKKISKPSLRLKIANNINTRSSSRAGTSSAAIAAQGQTRSSTATTNYSPINGKMIAGLSTPYPGKLIANTSIGKRNISPSQKVSVNVAKGYTNKNDFISTEMPSELFESTAGGSNSTNNSANTSDISPMLGELSAAGFNPTLSEDYTKKVFPSSEASSANGSGGKNMAVTMFNKGKMTTADDVNLQLECIQGDLDSIKDLFKNDDYTLDANALLGTSSGGIGGKNRLMLSPSVDSELFSKIFGDLDAPYGLSLPSDFAGTSEPSGSELMTYQQPSFSSANLNEFLAPDDQINPEDEEPDYLSHDLNTPKVERKNLSFRTRDN